jgi:hypothetical protein
MIDPQTGHAQIEAQIRTPRNAGLKGLDRSPDGVCVELFCSTYRFASLLEM